jgi:CheY-like chemotaxis protein
MDRRNTRVLLACEHLETRSVLRRIVESEDRATIVAEAENSVRAMELAQRLRPDIAVVDSYLPHTVGYDELRMSRMAGLDVAQCISEEMPSTRVVLLNRFSRHNSLDSLTRTHTSPYLCRESMETCVPFTLQDLWQEPMAENGVVFANLDERPAKAERKWKPQLTDAMVFFGILASGVGWTMYVNPYQSESSLGVFVILAGAALGLSGLAGKLIS